MVLERISRDEMLMEMAFVVAKRGTCSRAQVGCVISRDGRIIVTGYNGAPAGIPHCEHDSYVEGSGEPIPDWLWLFLGDVTNSYQPSEGDIYSYEGSTKTITVTHPGRTVGCQVVEHAERNAIAFAARWGTALEGAEIHCTHAPCLACAKSILNAGIKRLTFTIPYRLTEGVELLQQAKLEIVDLSLQK